MGEQKTPEAIGIAASGYAQQKRQLVGLINEIRSSRASLVVDLPRIAVIGKQSAGKSSLIGAISGVPRDSGTCTKCPMEVRIQSADGPWRCQIRLRRETDEHGVPLPSVRETAFGNPISDSYLIEAMLKRAQLAILNPSVEDSTKFVSLDLASVTEHSSLLGSTKQLDFSSNVICVDISGPDVTDLAFVDLPGIVANGEQKTIDLVKDLVAKYIKGNCLILVALTIGDDIENQSAAHLAKQEDPKGERTIGVLTKPDLLPPGEETMWLEILRNKRHPLLHGYFVAKQPSLQELRKNPTFKESRAEEEEFFRTGIWSSLNADLKDRLGTAKLTAFLSDRLTQFIQDKLPSLIGEINESYAAVVEAERALHDKPSDDSAFKLLQRCTKFAAAVAGYSIGTADHESLAQAQKKVFSKFRSDILATVPQFVPFEKSSNDVGKKNYEEPTRLTDEIDLVDGDNGAAKVVRLRLDLNDTRAEIDKAITRELPHSVPFGAKRKLILASLTRWPQLAVDCLKAVRPLVRNTISSLIEEHFGRFEQGPLRGFVAAAIAEEIESLYAISLRNLEWLAKLDAVPFTQNDHYFSATRQKILSHHKEVRKSFDADELDEDVLASLLSSLAEAGLPAAKENLGRLLDDDEFLEELEVVAETRAYFQIAFKRIIDLVHSAIDHDLIRALPDRILERLVRGLGIQGERGAENARAMLAESATVAMQREELGRRRTRLEGPRKALRSSGIPAPSG